MNLAIDFGNTRIKTGAFDRGRLEDQQVFGNVDALLKSRLLDSANYAIVCSVTEGHDELTTKYKGKASIILFKPDMAVPIKNAYKSALTLGSDRLAVAVGAHQLYPGENLLCIDAGTCIKYNFVSADGTYHGGAISPGIPMRLRSMHQDTKRLPDVKTDFQYKKLVGQSSVESLLSGAQLGAACEADAMIDRYQDTYGSVKVLLTGGDGPYLAGLLKNPFFAHQNLLLQGLHVILEFNLPH